MTTSSALRAAALLAALVLFTGCTSFELSRLGHDLARDIERSTDARVEPGYAIAFGRGQIGTARFLARAASPTETAEARQLLGHVRYAAFGRYPLRGTFDGRTLPAPRALDRYRGDGWFPFVTVRDSASAVWVLLRERDDGDLTDLVTVIVAEDDVVLTKVSGDLDRIVLDAIEMGGDGGLFGGALDEARIVVRDESEPEESEDVPPADPEPDG